jgi:hypothetical protein
VIHYQPANRFEPTADVASRREVEAELSALRALLADAHARIGRLREMALASVRPAGLITSPESVRWFNARNKCDAQNDLTPPTAEGASDA